MEINTEEMLNNIELKTNELEKRLQPDYELIEATDMEVEYDYDESTLPDELEYDFEDYIVERGEKYHKEGRVTKLIKCNNSYFAQVHGNREKPYFVSINIYGDDEAEYSCDCPYDDNCKHEYAVLLAIANKEYDEVELKNTINSKDNSLRTLIKRIPSDYLKEYILSLPGKDEIVLNHDDLKENFPKYVEKEDYEYYYNNLYNKMILNNYYATDIDDYLAMANSFLNTKEFVEVFKIIKSIIEAYKDSDKLNYSDIELEIMNKIGMLLRICYRRADEDTKKEIQEYKKGLEDNNYYDNYYLEDILNI